MKWVWAGEEEWYSTSTASVCGHRPPLGAGGRLAQPRWPSRPGLSRVSPVRRVDRFANGFSSGLFSANSL
jgi:hypothetical protein